MKMESRSHITLSELQRHVKEVLTEQFEAPLWVSAELSELKVNYSGHCYMELIEKGRGSANGVPTAQARAVIWRSNYPRIAGTFEATTGQKLTAGLRILAQVLVTYHELYGFSLQIIDIDPAYTLGDMEQQRLETIARLEEEGVWDMNRELAMPLLVQRIALISSAQAAGYQDFCKELARTDYAYRLTLFDAYMQGAAAEESILAALNEVAARQEEFDVVVIVRGGGSVSDLNCFNAYRLCSHIAQFPLPVLTGIGHDKDQSVADMVAHTPLKTPTAVAGWLNERMERIEGWLEGAAQQLHDAVIARMRDEELQLEQLGSELSRRSVERMVGERLRLEQLQRRLPELLEERFKREVERLEGAREAVESRSPERILQLGFAIVRAEGKALKRLDEIQAANRLEIEVAEGKIEIEHSTR